MELMKTKILLASFILLNLQSCTDRQTKNNLQINNLEVFNDLDNSLLICKFCILNVMKEESLFYYESLNGEAIVNQKGWLIEKDSLFFEMLIDDFNNNKLIKIEPNKEECTFLTFETDGYKFDSIKITLPYHYFSLTEIKEFNTFDFKFKVSKHLNN